MPRQSKSRTSRRGCKGWSPRPQAGAQGGEQARARGQAGTPLGAMNERSGEHIRFMARTRSQIAKRGGDALGDLEGGDVDAKPRTPAPPALSEIVTGGELAPVDEFRDTVTNPDVVT